MIQRLMQRVAELERKVRDVIQVQGNFRPGGTMRTAQTKAIAGIAYPSSGSTIPIRFISNDNAHSEYGTVECENLAGVLIPEDVDIAVFDYRGELFTWWGTALDECDAELSEIISTTGANYLYIDGTDGKLRVSPSTSTGNMLGTGGDGYPFIKPSATSGNLLTKDGSDGYPMVLDTTVKAAIPRSFMLRCTPDNAQALNATYTTITLAASVLSESGWNFDNANDQLEFTGSPDFVRVRLQMTTAQNTAGATISLKLLRNGAAAASYHGIKTGDTLTHMNPTIELYDASPGSNPYYEVQAILSAGTGTIGSTTYNDFIEAEAYYR